MSLPFKPMIDPVIIVRGKRPHAGHISPGGVFAWEPDKPHARELVVVTKVENGVVSSRGISDDTEYWNDEDRFREASYATIMKPHSIKRPSIVTVPWPFSKG